MLKIIKLKEIFNEIENDKNMEFLDLNEQVDVQTYYLLLETMDINNFYENETTGRFFSTFKDSNNIKHFIRIIYQPISKIPDAWVLKMGFFKEDNSVSYDRPNLIFNLKPDEKILNTYIKILINDFLEKDDFFSKAPENSKLYLPATDYPRYRLYRMALNKFLDKNKYKVLDFPEVKNCLTIEKIITNV